MTAIRISANKVGWISCALLGGLLAWMLAGCRTHRERVRSGGYYESSPRVGASFSAEIRSENDFYEPLSPYGRWEVVGSYGRCWIPGRVNAGWRPYCNGYWQRTDAGWYWASDEPWGWATYHYGRWDLSAQYGWYWVPQTQWAPAWVSWHEGGGYIGWAPLLPSVRISASGYIGFNASLVSPRAYVFVEQRHFLSPVRPNTVIVNNTTIISKTVNITKIKVVNKTVINEGPNTATIEKVSGRKVQAVSVRELRHKDEAAFVAKQRPSTATSEKNSQAPARSDARKEKAVTAREQRQVDRRAEQQDKQEGSKERSERRAQKEKRRGTGADRDPG